MLTITNWNIERVFPRSHRWKRVEEMLNQLQADVVVLTEAHTHMSPGKGFNGVFGGIPYGEFRQGEVRCAIWSQFELLSLSELVGDLPDCAAARLIHPIYGGISVFACILPYLGRSWQGIPTKGGQAFQSALADFRAAWNTIVDRFPEDTLIVAGDFNQSMTRSHYYGSYIQRAALERVLAEDELNILTAMDDDPVMRASHPHACIDHICVSRSANLQLLQSERWPDTAAPDRSFSDHFAIKVQLEK